MVEYTCAECKETKNELDFGLDVSITRGRKYSCKDCLNSKRRGRYHEENRKYHLKSKYNLTPEEYHEMYSEQRGCCAIYKQPPSSRLYVDHCHTTNTVRGLLCHSCNVALGHFKDNSKIIKNALDYLKENAHEDA